jgi:pimeloyl-ACP methyl ester carboxylesterase
MIDTRDDQIRPFRISFSDAELDDLHQRIDRTRWPEEVPGSGWEHGVPTGYARELAQYWRHGFDWGKQQERLNGFPQFMTTIEGQTIHFVHVRSAEPGALPLILTHGWPTTFIEFLEMVGPLTDPRSHGGDPADAFDVVIPSVPGYGFSMPLSDVGWSAERIAEAWNTLMKRLGYERYGAQGGDLGSFVCRQLGVLAPEGLVGIHVMQIFAFPSGDPTEMASLTEEDHARLAILGRFRERGGYNEIQSTRPLTLEYGLHDSPVGTLAWNLELPTGFGDTVDMLDRDVVLTNVTLFWLTGTSGTAARVYYANAHGGNDLDTENATPTGVAVFEKDFKTIRTFAERANTNIVHWSEFDRGGHFAALETPDLLVEDLRTFFRPFR